jgi:fatty-acyl-CoA synthase
MINLSGEKSLPPGWLDFDELCAEKYSDEEPYVDINGDDVLTLMYTSGTEAMPKGVLNSHSNWFSSIMNFCMDFGRATPPDQIQLGAIPLFHVAGHLGLLMTLACGDKMILLYTTDPGEVMSLISSEKITSIGLAPTVFVNMLNMPNGEELMKNLFGTVRNCTLYGSPMPAAMMSRVMDILPDVYWQNYYGQSELTPLGTTLKSPDIVRKFREAEERFGGVEPIGQSHAVVEMKVVDDNDNEVPPGTVGEMVTRSPAAMLGYYKEEEKTKETFRGGWHHTGDLAIMDEERFLYFVDRKKDIIRTGAENVSSVEVEQWVGKYPKVSECTAVGIPHERWGEAVTVFVAPKPGESITEQELIEYCKQGLAGYKVPKKVIMLNELPKNPSGKILKKDLRKEYQDVFASEK